MNEKYTVRWWAVLALGWSFLAWSWACSPKPNPGEANQEPMQEQTNDGGSQEQAPEVTQEATPEVHREVISEPVKEAKPESMKEARPETLVDASEETMPEVMQETGKEARPEENPDIRPDAIPTSGVALFAWLKAGKYKSFSRESKVHPSSPAHGGQALVFINDILDASLKAGNKSHAKGSALVKELYDRSGKTLRGWAVQVKTAADSDGGKNWYWYEILSTTSSANPVVDGKGEGLCTGCHSGGNDFMMTSYPLK